MNTKILIMKEEKINIALLKFGIPSIIGFLVTALYNFVDALFIGNLGKEAMGAASVSYPISLVAIGIGLLLGSGAASYISRLLGQKKVKESSQTAALAFWGSIIISLIIIIPSIFFLPSILAFFGATVGIMPFAKDYGYIFVAGSFFSILNITLNHIARAEGSANLSMFALMVGAIVNIILDPILIYTLNLGIQGAAIATFFSQALSTIILISHFKGNSSVIKLNFSEINFNSNTFKYLKEIIAIGIPYCLAQLLAGLSMALINKGAAPYGDEAIAAMGITNRIFSIGIYAMIGYSKGYQPIAGYNFGAKNKPRLKLATKLSIKWSTIISLILAILQIIFSKQLVSLFSNDIDVINISAKALIAYSFMLPLFGYQIIIMTLFLATGHAKEGFLLSISRQGLFLIPLILTLPTIIGLNGVIITQPLADLITTIFTFILAIKLSKKLLN